MGLKTDGFKNCVDMKLEIMLYETDK